MAVTVEEHLESRSAFYGSHNPLIILMSSLIVLVSLHRRNVGEHINIKICLHSIFKPLTCLVCVAILSTIVCIQENTSDTQTIEVLVVVCSTHRSLVKHHLQGISHIDTMELRMRVRALVSVVIMVSDTWIERSINTHELIIQMLHSLLSLLLRHFTVGNVTKTSEEVKAYILRQSHHVFHSDVNQVWTFS